MEVDSLDWNDRAYLVAAGRNDCLHPVCWDEEIQGLLVRLLMVVGIQSWHYWEGTMDNWEERSTWHCWEQEDSPRAVVGAGCLDNCCSWRAMRVDIHCRLLAGEDSWVATEVLADSWREIEVLVGSPKQVGIRQCC